MVYNSGNLRKYLWKSKNRETRMFCRILCLLVGFYKITVIAWDIGVASSAFQVEGGRYERGSTIWDDFCGRQGAIVDGNNADIACDSYNLYGEDVYWIETLGVKNYRLSLSWARLFPDGNVSNPNTEGFRYYHKLLDTLREHDIDPHVTLFHWDLPSALQNSYGGMLDREHFRSDFRAYTDAVLQEYGRKINVFYTFNEPYTICSLGFGTGAHAPGIQEPVRAPYDVGHTILLAHADAWKIFNEKKKLGFVNPDARVSIVLNSDFYYANDPLSATDMTASDRAVWFRLGWFLSPILTGQYPDVMKQIVGDRLSPFSPEESHALRGSVDFIALNYYTSMNVKDDPFNTNPNFFADPRVIYSKIPQSLPSASSWLFLYPQGLHGLVSWVVEKFPDTKQLAFQITENGISTSNTDENDSLRVQCMSQTFAVVDSINKNNIANVSQFFVWSLMDNFEWSRGYTEAFGLLRVDFTDPQRKRIPRTSFYWLQDYLHNQN